MLFRSLIKGSYREWEKRYRRPIYFDQYGVLVKTFDIKNIPAQVSQDRDKLKIEEIAKYKYKFV